MNSDVYRDPIPFQAAIDRTEPKRRHLLLGNGFSIAACRRFHYDSLIEQSRKVDFAIPALIRGLGASDFEDAMRRAPPALRPRIRKAFVDTIAYIHPERSELPARKRAACADFLAYFLRAATNPLRGDIFTTNYDAVLSWVLMEHKAKLSAWDGFDPSLTWHESRLHRSAARRSVVHYLHGALHYYEEPARSFTRVKRIKSDQGSWKSLPETIREAVAKGMDPTLVSEGLPREKADRMRKNPYLAKTAEHFNTVCQRADDVLFTYGHRLAAVDRHLTSMIPRGAITELYVGVFDRLDAEWVRKLASDFNGYRTARAQPTINISLYASPSAPVWGAADP